MPQNKIYAVTALGLPGNELRFIKIMLALTSHASTARVQGRYEWTEDLGRADVVMVNAEDEVAMHRWHQLSREKYCPVLMLVTSEQTPDARYYFSRPYGPAKVLMWLDKIVKDRQSKKPEAEIFSGARKSMQSASADLTSGVLPARHRALVVDDSPTVRKQLVLELGCFNIKVDTAETGEQGLEMLRENHYDIIFLDIVLPGVDGYQVCKSVRKFRATKSTPVVMLTSKSSPFDKVRGSLVGCNSYLTKPVNYENFYHVLESYLVLTPNSPESKIKCA